MPGNTPIPQPVVGPEPSPAAFFQLPGNGGKCLAGSQAVKLPRVYQSAFLFIGAVIKVKVTAICRGYHRFDGQIVFLGEFPVTLIVPRHSHHRAGSVTHQDEISHPYRQRLPGQRVVCVNTQRHTFFFHGLHQRFRSTCISVLAYECVNGAAVPSSSNGQGMLHGHRQVTGAEQGVGAGGIHHQFIGAARKREIDLHALRPAYPVPLHGAYRLRPTGQVVQFAQQFLAVFGDFQKPLRYFFPFHRRAGTPAPAVNNLLIGQHGLVDRVPVDRRGLPVNHPLFI